MFQHRPQLKRLSRALRRLLEGKTTAINNRVARILERDGLVMLGTVAKESSAVPATLTPLGMVAAEKVEEGMRVYGQRGRVKLRLKEECRERSPHQGGLK